MSNAQMFRSVACGEGIDQQAMEIEPAVEAIECQFIGRQPFEEGSRFPGLTGPLANVDRSLEHSRDHFPEAEINTLSFPKLGGNFVVILSTRTVPRLRFGLTYTDALFNA